MTISPTQLAEIEQLIRYRSAAGVGRGGMDERSSRTLYNIFSPNFSPGLRAALKDDAVTLLLRFILATGAGGCTDCANLSGVIDPNGEIVPQFAGQIYVQTNTGQVWENVGGGVDDEWTVLAQFPIED